MSIIADTLKRLQAQSTNQSSEFQDDPPPRPTFNKGEGTGHHQRASQSKFWIISAGISLALVGLAFGAFWLGWHMDFGLAPQTQASITSQPSALSPSQPYEAEPADTVSASMLAEGLESIPSSPTHSPERLHSSTDPETLLPKTTSPTPPRQDTPLISEENMAPGISENLVASLDTENEKKHPTINTQRDADQEEQPISLKSNTQEFPPDDAQPTVEETETTIPSVTSASTANLDSPKEPDTLTASLDEEEIIQPDEFVITSMVQNESPDSTEHESLPTNVASKPSIPTLPPQQKLSPAQQLRQARQFIQKGEYEEASTLLSPLFHDPPVDWQPWFWMGTALLGKGEMEQADQFFLSGLARNDKVPQLWIQRALVAQQRGNYQLAIHELRQAESLDGDLPHIPLNMGYAYEQLGNDRLANQYYGKFLKLSEGNPEFFPIRKKLFARLTQSISTKQLSPSSDTASP